MRAANSLHDMLRFRPETRAGRWSLGLFGLVLVGYGMISTAVAGGQRTGDTVFDNWWLAIPMAVVVLGGAASGAVGGYAIVWRSERAVLVMFATTVALLCAGSVTANATLVR